MGKGGLWRGGKGREGKEREGRKGEGTIPPPFLSHFKH